MTCGGGVQQRKQMCSESSTNACTGQPDIQTLDCNTQDCPSKLKTTYIIINLTEIKTKKLLKVNRTFLDIVQ